MPLFSAFTPFGAGFAFSGAPSHGETIYRMMISSLGAPLESYGTEEGTRMRAFCYAQAMMASRVLYTLEHAGFQLDPLKVAEMLVLREGEYGLIPGPNESIDDRRAALAARLLAPKGGWYNNIKNALITLLGAEFVGYVPTVYADSARSPIDCGDQPMNLISSNKIPSLLRLLDGMSISLGSSRWVRYEDLELPAIPQPISGTLPVTTLSVGDTIVVDPSNNGVMETVEITGLRELTPGVKELQAIFDRPHDADVIAASVVFPYWRSTKRYNLAVLKSDAAADPETRRKTNELLERMVRAVSTWSIAQEDPTNPQHTGVFQIGVSHLSVQTVRDVVVPL